VAKKVKALFRASVKFGGGGYGKNTARLGCKIPAAICNSKLRDEYFINRSLHVVISLDPKTDSDPVLDGMEDFACVELKSVKVNQYSTNDSDVTFSMTFGKTDMPSEFLQRISHANGSIYILAVEEPAQSESKDDDSEESEDDDESEEDE